MDDKECSSILRRLKLEQNEFDKLGLKWDELKKIYFDHVQRVPDLEKIGLYVTNKLMIQKNVHSVRSRIKDPSGLIAKIIRKKRDDPKRVIDFNNYRNEITDLIGIRAIHLMKNQWHGIDKMINKEWNLKEPKKAFIREGDSKEFTNQFAEGGFEIKTHDFGYRSLHYIIDMSPGKDRYYIEIQVRTIFEEGWSEIDHKVRYPNSTDNELFGEFLSIFNRIAGSADEMGSFIMNLKLYEIEKRMEVKDQLREKDKKIKELESSIKRLDIDTSVKSSIMDMVNNIGKSINEDGFVDSPLNLSKFGFPSYLTDHNGKRKLYIAEELEKLSEGIRMRKEMGSGRKN